MSITKYEPSQRERRVLDHVENPRYDRQILNGLDPFVKGTAPEDMRRFYSEAELDGLLQIRGTARDIEQRMPVKMTRHYFELARNSPALQKLVKASPDETLNLEGAEDPGYEMDFSPVEGLLHKYEMGLLYVVSTCSAHCRFCYREELIARKDIEAPGRHHRKEGHSQDPRHRRLRASPQHSGRSQRRRSSQNRGARSCARCCYRAATRWCCPTASWRPGSPR